MHNLVDLKLKNSEGVIKHHTWVPIDDSPECINNHIEYIITAMCLFYGVNKSSLGISVEKVDTMLQSIDSYRENFLDNFSSLFAKIINQKENNFAPHFFVDDEFIDIECNTFQFSAKTLDDFAGKKYVVAKLSTVDENHNRSNSIGFYIIPFSTIYKSHQKDKIMIVPFYLKNSSDNEAQVHTFTASTTIHDLFYDYQIETEFICPEPEQIVNCVYKICQETTALLLKVQTKQNSEFINSLSDFDFYSTSIAYIENAYQAAGKSNLLANDDFDTASEIL